MDKTNNSIIESNSPSNLPQVRDPPDTRNVPFLNSNLGCLSMLGFVAVASGTIAGIEYMNNESFYTGIRDTLVTLGLSAWLSDAMITSSARRFNKKYSPREEQY